MNASHDETRARAAWARRILPLLDLTDLTEDSSPADIVDLCRSAMDPRGAVAAVCVWPRHVAEACALLDGTPITVATVVNFPAGTSPLDEVLAETRAVLDSGADEVDLVLPWEAFLEGDVEAARTMVAEVRATVSPPRLLKVILEAGLYPDQEAVRRAAELAIDAGADFVKTSTGKTAVSATSDAVTTLLEVIRERGRPVGIKPSGGMRTVEDAAAFLAIADAVMGDDWPSPETFRFGASSLHTDLLRAIDADLAAPLPTSQD